MVDIVGRAKIIVESDLDTRSFEQSGGKIGGVLKKGALVGVAALGALATGAVKAALAFEEAEAVSRKLTTVLGNMGKANAAPAVEALASSLQRLTGVDDEVIKGGQTILATFSAVAKSAGQMGGTFERATALSLDLAAAGFGSVEAGSKALGKALQDPEKGITALTRAGVTFTPIQKQQIADFLAAGDAAAAQAVILAEVERQVGGTAEAGAKASVRLKSAFGEVQESLGFLLSDLFDTGDKKSVVDIAADATFKLADAVEKFQKSPSWTSLKSDITGYARDLKTVADFTGDIVGEMDKFVKTVSGDKDHGLLFWLGAIQKYTTPLRQLANLIRTVQNALDKLNGTDKGSLFALPKGALDFNAAGVRNYSGGLSVVGERGPEIVNLPRGTDVYSNQESRRMVASTSGGGSVHVTQIFNGPNAGSEAARAVDFSLKYGTRFGAATAAGGF